VAGGNWPFFRPGNAEYGALYIHFAGFATWKRGFCYTWPFSWLTGLKWEGRK
jgi:hypothetical protein